MVNSTIEEIAEALKKGYEEQKAFEIGAYRIPGHYAIRYRFLIIKLYAIVSLLTGDKYVTKIIFER